MKRTLLTLLSIFCVALTVNSQTVWAAKTTIDAATGNNPYTIANGLIDGDSNLDIVIGTDEDHILVWYKGNGDGTFVKQTAITNTLMNIGGIKLVDLNNDGDKDILAVGFGAYSGPTLAMDSKLVWFANNGSGSFGAEQLITDSYDGMSGLFVGAIDAGATPDIAVTASADNEVVWFSNDGSGSFTLAGTIDNTLTTPGVVNMKDIDADGDLDALIATAVYGGDVIEIFRNDLVPGGAVAFAKDATSVATGKEGFFNATFEDIDGDANLDILATEISYGGGSGGQLYWYEDNGAGYTENTFTTTTNNPAVAQFRDLDNDGLKDIIVSSGALADVADLVWFKNNGAGSFGAEQVINDTQSQVFVYNVADFDGDLDLDIASNAYGADNLNYIENLLETLGTDNFDVTSIKIFPNPARDILNFEGFNTSIEVSIFDVLGKSVLSKSLNTNETLDVSELVSGIYTITINGTFASKFIKE
ncbi:T9SS type A sorting domain-containing protein [Winogradskyella sp.]|uniref:T9SS type A sorting domain-containing protein n=1 Tax=Winogradskyella sp. TaxID=1883156 RepID=UPI0025DCD160|nr:T9SS type A sorting domain-containing protein [Winogradskyella sp.]